MLVASLPAAAQSGLFISEVADPGDEYTGRFIELFNAGSETVDFDTELFFLARQSNGGTTWGEVQLTGSVAAGATYIIGGSAFESFYGFAPDLVTGILTGNGDDPYSLYSGGDHETGTIHDIYGEQDTDGTGEPWEYTDSRAVRIETVQGPGTLWSAAEWSVAPADIADCDPGTHHGSGGGVVIPEGDFALAVVSDTVEDGQFFYAAVQVSQIEPADDVISFQFDVHYDPAMLSYAGSSVSGTLADGGTIAENNAVAGSVSISYMHTDPLSGSGQLLLMQFEPLALGASEISLSNAFVNNLAVPEVFSGTILVAETSPPEASVFYGDTINRLADMLQITALFNEAMDAAAPVYLDMSGAVVEQQLEMVRLSDTSYSYLYIIPRGEGEVQVTLSGGTDMNGNEVVAVPVSGGTFEIIGLTPGDVNDDGAIQAYDAALALQHSVGLDPLPEADPLPWEAWRDSTANVDGSGSITAYDAGLILQYSAGIILSFPSGATKSLLTGETESLLTGAVDIEVNGGSIIFRAGEELVGLNIRADRDRSVLGFPQVVSAQYLSEQRIDEGVYRVGLCTDVPVEPGTELLRIPFEGDGIITLELNVNGKPVERVLDLQTRIKEYGPEKLNIHPNPVGDMLFVNGLESGAACTLLDMRGSVVEEFAVSGESGEFDLVGLKRGIYVLRVAGPAGVRTGKIIKQ